jgi:NADH dehydrogenase
VPAEPQSPSSRRPHVVILGGGFAGLAAARILGKAPVDVTLVDRTNHHLFQPLLYQVATAVLAPSDITVPIRWVLRKHRNTMVLLADAREIDVEHRIVFLDDERRELMYDYLIIATGARHSYFGHDDWEDIAPGLKSIVDGEELRRRFLLAFELAEKTIDPDERDAYQTFVIVGGGPTGVELAGMISPTARLAMHEDFRRIDTRRTRVLLLEGGPRILPSFPEDLSADALEDLKKLGVEVRLNAMVTNIDREGVDVGTDRIPARTVFWAAGIAASPLGRQLGAPVDRAGRVQVSPDLSVPGHPEIFVAGDLCAFQSHGRPVPGVAPAANQQGAHAARNILHELRREPRKPFVYFDKGDLATIGRHKAIASFNHGRIKLEGYFAWFLWLFVHIMYLVGFRNRASVLVQWTYAYLTYQRGVRLINGEPTPARRAAMAGSRSVTNSV